MKDISRNLHLSSLASNSPRAKLTKLCLDQPVHFVGVCASCHDMGLKALSWKVLFYFCEMMDVTLYRRLSGQVCDTTEPETNPSSYARSIQHAARRTLQYS